MKKSRVIYEIIGLALLVFVMFSLSGCNDPSNVTTTTAAESNVVATQDGIYAKGQPVPLFNYSLPRDLWIQFYKASTSDVVRTWSVEVSDYGTPISEVYQSVGYPIPMDTQLTNPSKMIDNGSTSQYYFSTAVVAQSEPNGLYTSPNTNATIIMVADANGNVSPIYSEHKVQCWSFPVKWDESQHIFVRVSGSKSSITLNVKPKK